MKRVAIVSLSAAYLALAIPVWAQQMYVYPKKGQSQKQQDVDTAECTRSAKAASGVDPNAPPPPDQLGSNAGGAVRGGAKGAALGAGVGAIAGNAGKGAAAGAVVGGVAGRRNSKQQKQAAQAQATDSFQRAFAACMDARGYSVK